MFSDELGFQASDGDPCMYVKHSTNGIMLIDLYVYNLLMAAKLTKQIKWIKTMLNELFDMKNLEEAIVCPGLEITHVIERKRSFGSLRYHTWKRLSKGL